MMATRNAAMTAAGVAAMGSAMTAALMIWLLLARPIEVVDALRGHELEGLARLAFSTLQGLVMSLLNWSL